MGTDVERLLNKNPEAPHRAIIWLEAEVHEILKTGECSGMSVYQVKRFPVYVDGTDRPQAIKKLNEMLSTVKELSCPKQS